MARPIYQYKPYEDDDQPIGILLPLNKGAQGKSPTANYADKASGGKGVFESSYTTKDAVVTNLKNLILTQKGERYMQPNFGTNIRKVLFENNTSQIREILVETIEEDIQYWLPYVKLKEIDLSTSDDKHSLNIRMFFSIESVRANVVINVLANENTFEVVEVVDEDDQLVEVGTFGADTAFNTGGGGSY